MGMTQPERHTRDQTLFYMSKSTHKLSANGAISIISDPAFKSFLLYLVEQGPKEMDPVLKVAAKKVAGALKVLEARREQERKEMREKGREKKKAVEEGSETCDGEKETGGGVGRKAKKAKLVSSRQEHGLGSLTARTSSSSAENSAPDCPPPPYPSKSFVDNSDIESDDGVELAMQESTALTEMEIREPDVEHGLGGQMVVCKPQQQKEGNSDAEEDNDDHDGEEDVVGMNLDPSREIVIAEQALKADDQQTDTSEIGGESRLREKILKDKGGKRKDQHEDELCNEESQANAQLERNANEQAAQPQNEEQSMTVFDQTKDTEQSIHHVEPQISQAELDYAFEVGLTRGDAGILFKLQEAHPILQEPEVARVFELCQKLDFDRVHSALVNFLQNRLAEREDPQKLDRVPSTCDLKDPDAIYDALRITNAHTAVAKIYRAYGQMRLFETVIVDAGKNVLTHKNGKRYETYLWHLEVLATRKAENVSDDEKKAKIKNYKDEYHGGRKWTQVAKWFGGKGVIMVFILAGIGSQLVAKGLKDCQRLALMRLAPYLKSVRKMIKTLGRNVLDEYCRDGHLSKEKILELENLEACLPEERSGSDGEEEDEEEEVESEGEY